MSYSVPAGRTSATKIIKKSRFIAIVDHATNEAQARETITNCRQQYTDARHACFAYIAGSPDAGPRALSDDGEPAGTAGKPIMNVLQHSGTGQIVAVVIRYFGGIKLGAGGLVRAYSSAVAEVIQTMPLLPLIERVQLKIQTDYSHESGIRHLLQEWHAHDIQAHYQDRLTLLCQIEPEQLPDLKARLLDLTSGKINITVPCSS